MKREIFANAEEKRPEMKEFEKWEKFKNLIISLYNSKQNKENGFVTICSENQLPILHEVPIAIRSVLPFFLFFFSFFSSLFLFLLIYSSPFLPSPSSPCSSPLSFPFPSLFSFLPLPPLPYPSHLISRKKSLRKWK